jgi:Glycosyl hydrolase family 79, N-terminal domain
MKNIRAQHPLSTPALLTRRQAIEATLAAGAVTLLSACGSPAASASTGMPGSSTSQPKPTGPAVNASLTVSTAAAASISPAFAGLSYEKSTLYEPLFTSSNANLIGLFKRLGSSVLRIGGNSVDRNVWTPSGAGQTAGQIAPADVDALAAFLQATGWQCLYGVNLGGSGSAPYTSGSLTAATTPALAAQEIAYVASKLGSSLLGIEIGNEPDLYGNTYYPGGAWDLSTFETVWDQFRTAILAQTPSVAITGPADAGNESKWTVPFAQWASKSKISLLTQHYYRGNGQSATSTAANLVTPDSNLISDLATVKAGAQAIGVPYRMAECNSYYNGGANGVSNSYASSLWVIDYLFDCALGGASGVNFHGGGSGSGYTPIADSGGTVIEARPEYYGILLFNLAGQGDLLSTTLNAASLNATAYAVKPATGGLNLIVVNKDQTSNLSLSIQLPQSASSATLLELAQLSASLTATSGVTIQGATVAANGSFSPGAAYTLTTGGTQLTCYVPALSAVLIQIS